MSSRLRASLLLGASVVLLAVALITAYVIHRPIDIEKDYHPERVEQLDVQIGDSDPPRTLRESEPLPVRIRLKPGPDVALADRYAVYCYVVGDRGYVPKGVDAIETFQQFADPKAPAVRLLVMAGGKQLNLAPAPPPVEADYLQFCMLLAPKSFLNNRDWSQPLQLHFWLYPLDPLTQMPTKQLPPVWFFRHEFQVTPDGGSQSRP
jgi:hypothetical protein